MPQYNFLCDNPKLPEVMIKTTLNLWCLEKKLRGIYDTAEFLKLRIFPQNRNHMRKFFSNQIVVPDGFES